MTPHLDPALPIRQICEPSSNPNVMPPADFDRLVANIAAEGFLQPVLVRALENRPDRFEVVDGVHRVRAASEVGLDEVPAVVLPPDYPVEKVRLLQIGMNRLRGQLDLTMVAATLSDLRDTLGLDLTLSGFSEDDIEGLLAAAAPSDINRILAEQGGGDEPEDRDPSAPVFELRLEFDSAAKLKATKRALKKAAGKGGTLAQGMLRALGIE
jgi:ParB-like chromosome segregation protein Spo0J